MVELHIGRDHVEPIRSMLPASVSTGFVNSRCDRWDIAHGIVTVLRRGEDADLDQHP